MIPPPQISTHTHSLLPTTPLSPSTTGRDTVTPPQRRPPAPPPPMNGPRYNEFIQSQKVRVIDHEGENLGVMYTREAIEQAAEVGLDLVEVSPNAYPPVAKFRSEEHTSELQSLMRTSYAAF